MKDKIAFFLATWFCSGLIPPFILGGMAGTYGSLASLPLCYAAVRLARVGTCFSYLGVMLPILFIGLWSIPKAEILLGEKTDWRGRKKKHDQNQIVIDETFGMLMACFPAVFVTTYLWLAMLIAFGLFRLFDIVKVPPARFFDKMEDACGVMLDDLIAGLYAALSLVIIMLFSGWPIKG